MCSLHGEVLYSLRTLPIFLLYPLHGRLCSLGAIDASLPTTPTWSLPCDRRRVPEPPLPHAVGVCQTAQRSFGCRVARKHFFPLSSHVGVGDRHAQIAGCVAHGQLPRFCTGSRTLRRGVRFASHSTSGENSKQNIKDRNTLPKDKTNLS